MIDTALTYICDILNQHFKNEFSLSEDKVILSNIVNADGGRADNVDGKIVFFLISLDEESTLKSNINRSATNVKGSFGQKAPSLHFNMQLLFCANFIGKNYTEGLRYLSSLIRFFQLHSRIVPDQSAGLPQNINKLSFEICKLDYDQLGHLWSAIGSKLMPSILYKVGILVFDEAPVGRIVPPIIEPESRL